MGCLAYYFGMQKQEAVQRLFYLDNCKSLLTLLVIMHHVGQAYGPTGGYWDFQSHYRIPMLDPFFTINASFFMGLFFFISAYFIPSSFEKHGIKKFIRDRLVRYGIPILFGFFVIVPLDQYYSFITWRGGPKLSFFAYLSQAFFNFGDKPFTINSPSWPELNFGHLWFVQHLLVYTLIYALIRWAGGKRKKPANDKSSHYVPGLGSILLFCVVAAYLTGIVRIFYPLDRWVPFLYCIQLEPAHFISYLFSFLAGIWAFRYQWLTKMTKKTGWILFLIGFTLSLFLCSLFLMQHQYLLEWFDEMRFLYETVMGMTLIFGSIILSRFYLNRTNPVWQFLSKNAYGAYIFHVPIVIFFQATMESLPPLIPIPKFLMVSLLAMFFSFAFSHLIRLNPWVRKILG